MGWGFVAVEVDAPRNVVLRCLESFEDYEGMIPVVRSAKVLSRKVGPDGKTSARCQYRVSRFHLMISAIHRTDPEAGIVRFDLDPSVAGMVLREASGLWQVEALPSIGDGGHARSRVWLRVGLRACSLVPSCLIDYAAERALRRATTWLKPHVERLWQTEQHKEFLRALHTAHLQHMVPRAYRLQPQPV